jgi:hypothetical protein
MNKASTSSKTRTLEKKIAKLLAQLPPEFLLVLAKTSDQKEHWSNLRNFYGLLSCCWQAMHSGKDDPLAPLLKLGEISKAEYDYVWLTVDWYERLWELVQISFRYVRPELEQLKICEIPKSAYELLELILAEFATEQFDTSQKQYLYLPGRQLPEFQALAVKVFKGEELCPHEEKRLQLLLTKDWNEKAFKVNPVFVVTMAVCHKKAGGRQSIFKARLDAYHTAMFNVLIQEKRLHWQTGSHAWDKGKLINVK